MFFEPQYKILHSTCGILCSAGHRNPFLYIYKQVAREFKKELTPKNNNNAKLVFEEFAKNILLYFNFI